MSTIANSVVAIRYGEYGSRDALSSLTEKLTMLPARGVVEGEGAKNRGRNFLAGGDRPLQVD